MEVKTAGTLGTDDSTEGAGNKLSVDVSLFICDMRFHHFSTQRYPTNPKTDRDRQTERRASMTIDKGKVPTDWKCPEREREWFV